MAKDDKDSKELQKKGEELKKLLDAQDKLTKDMMKLAQKADDQKEMVKTLTNLMKSVGDAKKDIVKNMKG